MSTTKRGCSGWTGQLGPQDPSPAQLDPWTRGPLDPRTLEPLAATQNPRSPPPPCMPIAVHSLGQERQGYTYIGDSSIFFYSLRLCLCPATRLLYHHAVTIAYMYIKLPTVTLCASLAASKILTAGTSKWVAMITTPKNFPHPLLHPRNFN